MNAPRKLEFYNAINIGWSPKIPIFGSGDGTGGVAKALAGDQLVSYTPLFSELLAKKMPILVYFGEFDMKDGPRSQHEWIKDIEWDQKNDFYG